MTADPPEDGRRDGSGNRVSDDAALLAAVAAVWLATAAVYHVWLAMPPGQRVWGASALVFGALAAAVFRAERRAGGD